MRSRKRTKKRMKRSRMIRRCIQQWKRTRKRRKAGLLCVLMSEVVLAGDLR